MGSKIVPQGLRNAGWQLTTMDEIYGVDRSQEIDDIDWIRDATMRGECIITKDPKIARLPVEAQMVVMCDARVFALTSAKISGEQMKERLILHQDTIFRWAQRVRPPFVAGVYEKRVNRLRLAYPETK